MKSISNTLSNGCRHRLVELPVMDPTFRYRCLECSGTLVLGWSEDSVGKGVDDIRKLAKNWTDAAALYGINEVV